MVCATSVEDWKLGTRWLVEEHHVSKSLHALIVPERRVSVSLFQVIPSFEQNFKTIKATKRSISMIYQSIHFFGTLSTMQAAKGVRQRERKGLYATMVTWALKKP